ncbi:FtsX-like permease family protein [Belliella sp. DSM 107340]|uniref:FtsX-like permease family protein n=1 Tax=Belliella calami TaxID=2923436 RepID=A0ABS9UTP4_9BACT|nr:FtsX-like permease family protein [Belliella calami]MCH7399780.1 FtsX-like permease family protein [Belliella calami]
MIYNNIIIAWRNLTKRKLYASINIFGLSLGISSCMLVFALVWHINSFDKYHKNADNIYRLVTNTFEGSREYHTPGVPAVLPEAFQNDFSGIESSVLISGGHNGLITVQEAGQAKYFMESGLAYTTDAFFEVFDREVEGGQSVNILEKPNQAVISKKYAEKLFGSTDVIGKTFQFQKGDLYAVTAVMEDFPKNTDFPFEVFLSYENLKKSRESGGWNSIHSDDQFYLVIKEDRVKESINSGLAAFVEKYLGDNNRENRTHLLQPLTEIHFDERYSNFRYQVSSHTNKIMIGVAIFLLLTASINFINLSTALSGKRSKEVGLRKVFGGNRSNIAGQFLSETGIICLFAVFIAFVISSLAMPYMNDFLGTEADFSIIFSPIGLLTVFSIWLIISLISGAYPSLIISKLNPIGAIREQNQSKQSKTYVLRKGLVVFQFMITQFFIIGTLVLVMQMNHLRSADIGFQKDAVATFTLPERDLDKSRRLAERLRNLPNVDMVSVSFTEPASGSSSSTNAIMVESNEEYTVHIKPADEYYLDTYGLELLYGENLIKEDTITRYLATESFAKKAGFENPEDLLGVYVNIGGIEAPVAGVVKDFYSQSLKSEIEPTFIFQNHHHFRTVGVKVSEANANLVMEKAGEIFVNLYPEYPFEYSFLDEKIANFYESEQRMSTLFIIFSCIAVVVGCIGLYGLVSYMAAMKTKEIGVRKVLGASSAQVLTMFSKEYVVLLLIAFALAAPLAGYLMEKWLEDYASKIQLSWQFYLFSLLLVAGIAFLTVGYKSIQAAWANPSVSLKSE